MTTVQFNLREGLARRDKGMEKVYNAEVAEKTFELIVRILPSGWVGLPEVWRKLYCDIYGIPDCHHNVWGSIAQKAAKRGLVIKLTEKEAMQDPNSHGRGSELYRRTNITRKDYTWILDDKLFA